ncbi:MAG: hypothetical protein AAF351_11830 [Pseudomonadota bacterium]
MSKKECENLCIVDHANKLADRDRANPNRRNRKLIQTWDKTTGETTSVEIPDWSDSNSEDG